MAKKMSEESDHDLLANLALRLGCRVHIDGAERVVRFPNGRVESLASLGTPDLQSIAGQKHPTAHRVPLSSLVRRAKAYGAELFTDGCRRWVRFPNTDAEYRTDFLTVEIIESYASQIQQSKVTRELDLSMMSPEEQAEYTVELGRVRCEVRIIQGHVSVLGALINCKPEFMHPDKIREEMIALRAMLDAAIERTEAKALCA